MPRGFETPTSGKRTFYDEFDRESWPPHMHEDHGRAVESHKIANTAAEGYRIEREYGVIHHTIIDPMHNRFMGTPHTVLATWQEKKTLSDEHLTVYSVLLIHSVF